MIFTTPIEQVWPHLDHEQQERAKRLIARAESIICQRFPTTQQRIAEGTLDHTVVTGVIEDMVTRVLERDARGGMDKLSYPEVAMEWDNSGGAGAGSILFLTTDELLLLSPPATGGAFTIRPTGHLPMGPQW